MSKISRNLLALFTLALILTSGMPAVAQMGVTGQSFSFKGPTPRAVDPGFYNPNGTPTFGFGKDTVDLGTGGGHLLFTGAPDSDTPGDVTFTIPNYDMPDSTKTIEITMTYLYFQFGSGSTPTKPLPSEMLGSQGGGFSFSQNLGTETSQFPTYGTSGMYNTINQKFFFTDCPTSEVITLTGSNNSQYLDVTSISIVTVCKSNTITPEPNSLILCGIGAFGAFAVFLRKKGPRPGRAISLEGCWKPQESRLLTIRDLFPTGPVAHHPLFTGFSGSRSRQ